MIWLLILSCHLQQELSCLFRPSLLAYPKDGPFPMHPFSSKQNLAKTQGELPSPLCLYRPVEKEEKTKGTEFLPGLGKLLLYRLSHVRGLELWLIKKLPSSAFLDLLLWSICTFLPIHGARYLVSFLDLADLLSCRWIVYREYSSAFRILPFIIDENLEKEDKSSVLLQEQTEMYIPTDSWKGCRV